MDWPANSPDLSPIEFRWAVLRKVVRKLKPETIEDLRNTHITTWSFIPQSTIGKFCEGFERRLMLCLANGGESILDSPWHLSERHVTKEIFEMS
jgi:hypothetical protein